MQIRESIICAYIAAIIVDHQSTNVRHSAFLFELSNIAVGFFSEFTAALDRIRRGDADMCVMEEESVHQGLAPTKKRLVDEGEAYEAPWIVRREVCCHQLHLVSDMELASEIQGVMVEMGVKSTFGPPFYNTTFSDKKIPVQRDTLTGPNVDDTRVPSFDPPFPFENPSRESRFRCYVSAMLPQLLIPGTPWASGNDLIALGAQYPSVRDSFLACATLLLSNSGPPVPPDAVAYYSDAVRATRRMIQESRVKGTEDWLLLQALLLCIFERAQSGPSCGAMAHLLGASHIMALIVRNLPSPSTGASPFQQMCASSLLYHAATTAFLNPDISWLPESATWKQFEQFLEPSYNTLFAIPPTLCRLILETSRLARRTPLSDRDSQLANDLRNQLRPYLPLQPASEGVYSEEGLDERAEQIKKAAELYALAADILLLKAMQPDLTAKDSRVQSQVKQIMNALQSDVQGIFWNQHYSWPFAILGCVVQRETEMLFLLGRLEKLWERSHWGDIQRTTNLFRTMLEYRRRNGQLASLRDARSSNCPDLFDFLLHGDWLPQFMVDG
ncbi:hypothetical protein N7474_006580 [Penicillium riverlandense]|uniref:uncharacterized protein n=1 Tax=Penicillium riverlandense TaxID=1903569 RepID=UPI0025498320|nr:uncharacterized protein N7474_006580 [Penicillium riverlandense]KAJ5814803.1 hypothetical protein N7474_006580 [Penicillium riverlandense]